MRQKMEQKTKKPTTYQEQLKKLENRGCFIENKNFCEEILKSINYYRLTAYFLPFKTMGGKYKEGTSFSQVYRIYEFDRKLRRIIFSAIEEVEIFLRSRFAYFHAHKYGEIGYLDAANFSNKHQHEKFQRIIQNEIKNNQQSAFVKHHTEKYNGIFPLWVIIELFSFGTLSHFYNDLKLADQKILAREIYNTIPQNIVSWLYCCTDLRNICAHYGRLYYRIFPAIPRGIDLDEHSQRRLWGAVMALRNLYPDKEKWNHEILTSFEALFEEYSEDILLFHIAFPENWTELLKK